MDKKKTFYNAYWREKIIGNNILIFFQSNDGENNNKHNKHNHVITGDNRTLCKLMLCRWKNIVVYEKKSSH